jgi:hypothetical protein
MSATPENIYLLKKWTRDDFIDSGQGMPQNGWISFGYKESL